MATRRVGRPLKSETPIDWNGVDRLLVHGEVMPYADGSGAKVVYPSYREIAKRFNVSHPMVAKWARQHNVLGRRRAIQAKIQARVEERLIEQRAQAIVHTRKDQIRMLDKYLTGFERALDEGRVRFDNASDANTVMRLKEFLMGNADSRKEITGGITLELLRERHRTLAVTMAASPEETGEVLPAALPPAQHAPGSPAAPGEGAAEQTSADDGGMSARNSPEVADFQKLARKHLAADEKQPADTQKEPVASEHDEPSAPEQDEPPDTQKEPPDTQKERVSSEHEDPSAPEQDEPPDTQKEPPDTQKDPHASSSESTTLAFTPETTVEVEPDLESELVDAAVEGELTFAENEPPKRKGPRKLSNKPPQWSFEKPVPSGASPVQEVFFVPAKPRVRRRKVDGE